MQIFHRLGFTGIALAGLLILVPAQAGPARPARLDFDRSIAPLLAEHCLDCHGGPKPKGGLDLTRKSGIIKGGKGGPAVIAGQPDKSTLWQRVRDGEMPPKKRLPDADKAALKAWIASGANWGSDPIDPFRLTTRKRAGADWWSLQPVRRSDVPAVKDVSWVRNPIDRFILAKLEARQLTPSPEADRRKLIRRLSFDLIGLPPTPEEVEAFVIDNSADSYERLVDRLLASPHYGERWARHWLDVVRFGETDGFERNGSRPNAWHFRDWVWRAFNDDLPYDEFCRDQIAGDVLKPGDADAAKATGFLVAGIHNTVLPQNQMAQETAIQDELEDLVGSVGQTFLGLTVNCGRCHDHKFDPVLQKDYYRMASALAGVRHGEREMVPAVVQARFNQLQIEVQELTKAIAEIEEPARRATIAGKKAGRLPNSFPPSALAAWDFRDGGKDLVGGLHVQTVGGAQQTPAGLVLKTGLARSEPLTRDLREKTLEVWVHLDNLDQSGGGAMTVETPDGVTFDAVVFAERESRRWMAGSNGFVRTASFQAPQEAEANKHAVQIVLAYDADGTIRGYRNGKPYGKEYKSSGPATFAAGQAVVAFGVRHEPAGGNRMLAGTIVQARLYDRALTADQVAASAAAGSLVSEAEVTARLSHQAKQTRDMMRSRLSAISSERSRLQAQQSMKVYLALSEQPPVTRLLLRGQVTSPGKVLAAGGIAALARPQADFGLNANAPETERRKKLAEWLTSRENPLFARAMMNRLWHYHFGTGIVETPNDLGFNGGRPSHPELLDWLATEFVDGGYSLKKMHRLMVTSASYRQSASPRADGLAADSDVRLLWRKKPLRVEGEVLRDGMLAVSGLLNRQVGGRGFSDYRESGGAGTQYYDPYDPVGWAFQRRSLYRFSPRGGNQGLLDIFDCPDPASAAPRRNTTTTPLQALTLWNGAFAMRMAETFAARITAEVKRNPDGQVLLAYRLAFQREPLPMEREAARRLVERHGLKVLCRALFNTNEFLTVD